MAGGVPSASFHTHRGAGSARVHPGWQLVTTESSQEPTGYELRSTIFLSLCRNELHDDGPAAMELEEPGLGWERTAMTEV
ncbi:hypothetical protein PR202_gb15965 [Eleusine coracana subsp. coracana]|uniref:Uncharacterized protein n=1 Tax=Eleusine coracana subsp. coracana TaxID=191504 RepID=A0AAV5EYK7_ELECO|nr:hypothetical protein PR202_gb15965 [Eleusine coracana subsp. coracana]